MSKLFAKLFNLNADVAAPQITEVPSEVTVLQPHELSYTGGGGIPDILQ
ncbi:MAG: hypothetical protein ACK50D_11365 [Burkholderiales bacterium]|jgi:hypothetical protein